jgi:hypothetical protein
MLNHPSFIYWLADDKRVYSGPQQLIVTEADPDYVAWLAAGNVVNPWPRDDAGNQTNEALQDVLTPYSMFVDLVHYTSDVRDKKSNGGVIVNGLPFASDPVTMMSLNAAYIYTIDKASNEFSWKLPDGTFITLDTQGVKDLQSCVAGFGQDCFACEDDTLTAIEGGTITDRQQVDAAFAAVSNVFTSATAFEKTRRH